MSDTDEPAIHVDLVLNRGPGKRVKLWHPEPCQMTILSYYKNRIIECEVVGPHSTHAGYEVDGSERTW